MSIVFFRIIIIELGKYLLRDEGSFLNDYEYEDFYGFDEEEVKELCKVHPKPSYEELKYWYDGYYKSDSLNTY